MLIPLSHGIFVHIPKLVRSADSFGDHVQPQAIHARRTGAGVILAGDSEVDHVYYVLHIEGEIEYLGVYGVEELTIAKGQCTREDIRQMILGKRAARRRSLN